MGLTIFKANGQFKQCRICGGTPVTRIRTYECSAGNCVKGGTGNYDEWQSAEARIEDITYNSDAPRDSTLSFLTKYILTTARTHTKISGDLTISAPCPANAKLYKAAESDLKLLLRYIAARSAASLSCCVAQYRLLYSVPCRIGFFTLAQLR